VVTTFFEGPEIRLVGSDGSEHRAEREKLAAAGAPVWESGDNGELAWLYNADVEKEVLAYVKAETKSPRTCPVEWLTSKMSPQGNLEKVQP
jgi:hypothetical protein